MRASFLIGLLLSLTCVIAANWSPEDYEIFKLNDKIKEDLGPDTTFYTWLGLSNGQKSTLEEINKAYRKLSRRLHPDKFHSAKKSVKKAAEERFQRLSLVGNILRDNSLKQRYDYFLGNGFPKWKGTGYFYSRFRPGMLSTLMFLFVLVGMFHYFSMKISRKQDYKRIVDLKDDVKKRAWNGSLPPIDGSDRKVFNPNNGKEFMVSALGDVSLIENDEKEGMILHLLDEEDIQVNIRFTDTLFYRVPVFLYNKSLGRFLGEIAPPVYPQKKREDSAEDKPKPKKKKNKGEKIELPNGKVIYGRKRK